MFKAHNLQCGPPLWLDTAVLTITKFTYVEKNNCDGKLLNKSYHCCITKPPWVKHIHVTSLPMDYHPSQLLRNTKCQMQPCVRMFKTHNVQGFPPLRLDTTVLKIKKFTYVEKNSCDGKLLTKSHHCCIIKPPRVKYIHLTSLSMDYHALQLLRNFNFVSLSLNYDSWLKTVAAACEIWSSIWGGRGFYYMLRVTLTGTATNLT